MQTLLEVFYKKLIQVAGGKKKTTNAAMLTIRIKLAERRKHPAGSIRAQEITEQITLVWHFTE